MDQFRLDQNPSSPFTSFTEHAPPLSLFSHHAVGRNDLPKVIPQMELVYTNTAEGILPF